MIYEDVYMVQGGGLFCESMVDNATRCSCMLRYYKQVYILNLIQGCCSLCFFPMHTHCEMLHLRHTEKL